MDINQRFKDWIQNKEHQYFIFLFFTLTFYFFTFGTWRNFPYKIENDGKYYYQYLISGVYDHDFDFSNNYLVEEYPWMKSPIDFANDRNKINPITQRPINVFTMGPAILWLPLYFVTKIVGVIINAVGLSIDLNPWGKFFQYGVMYSAVIYTILSLYMLYLLLMRFFSQKIAILSTWLLLISTNLFYYTIFEPSMSHVYDLFTFVLFIFLFIKCYQSQRTYFYLSLAFAGILNVLVRTQNLVVIFLFSTLLVIIPLTQRKKLPIKSLLIYCCTLVIGLLLVPWLNNYLYGNPFAIPQGNSFLNLTKPMILEVLFSLKNGLFSQNPSLLLGILGFCGFLYFEAKKGISIGDKLFIFTLLISFFYQIYINSSVIDWWGGCGFGQRRLISSFPLFSFGFGFILTKLQKFSSRISIFIVGFLTFIGLYSTFLYVYVWNCPETHEIFTWMFYLVPKGLIKIIIS